MRTHAVKPDPDEDQYFSFVQICVDIPEEMAGKAADYELTLQGTPHTPQKKYKNWLGAQIPWGETWTPSTHPVTRTLTGSVPPPLPPSKKRNPAACGQKIALHGHLGFLSSEVVSFTLRHRGHQYEVNPSFVDFGAREKHELLRIHVRVGQSHRIHVGGNFPSWFDHFLNLGKRGYPIPNSDHQNARLYERLKKQRQDAATREIKPIDLSTGSQARGAR